MLKNIGYMVIGALLVAMVGSASAVIGVPPISGFALVDGNWLNGLANGHNNSAQYGIAAAGSSHSDSTQLAAQTRLYQIDTVGASTGVSLPPAVASGIQLSIYNNGLSTLTVYPSIQNNPVTGAQDTINNGTSFSGGVATHVSLLCFAAKAGVWACK